MLELYNLYTIGVLCVLTLILRKFMKTKKTVVLGAGVTGLAVAISSGADLVLEKESLPGGICTQYEMGGFKFHLGGGHWVFGKEVQLFLKKSTPMSHYTRRSSVIIDGKPIPYPIQNHIGLLGEDRAKIISSEIEACQGTIFSESTTMATWLEQSFGSTLYHLFFKPFHELYTAGLFHKVVPQDGYKTPIDLTKVRAGMGTTKGNTAVEEVGYNTTFIHPQKGLDALITSMAKNTNVQCNSMVTRIDTTKKIITLENGQQIQYENLISTLPLNVTLALTGIELDEHEPSYVSTLVLNIGARKGADCPSDHWQYFPNSPSGFHRVGFYSNVDPNFLPEHGRESLVSIYVERSYPGGNKPTPETIKRYKADVKKDLITLGYIEDSKDIVIDDNWIDVAYTAHLPQSAWLQKAIAALEKVDIVSIGRYGTWSFQGIAKSIKDGLMSGAKLNPSHALQVLDLETLQEVFLEENQLLINPELYRHITAENINTKFVGLLENLSKTKVFSQESLLKKLKEIKSYLAGILNESKGNKILALIILQTERAITLLEYSLPVDQLPELQLTKHGVRVDREKPPYKMNNFEQFFHQLFVHNGLAYVVKQSNTLTKEPATTHGMHTAIDQNRAIYAITKSGKIFFGTGDVYNPPYYYHNSFTDEEIVMAGLITLESGKITYIDNCSGHFQPTLRAFVDFLSTLQSQGLLNSQTRIGYVYEANVSLVPAQGLRILTQSFAEIDCDPRNLLTQQPTEEAFFIINFDGIISEECGAGRFTRNTIACLETHNEQVKQDSNLLRLRPFLVTPGYSDSQHPHYSTELTKEHKAVCARWQGEIINIDVKGVTEYHLNNCASYFP